MVILITGASRGVGAALLAEARAGGRAALGTARRPSGDLLPLDVTDPAAHRALAARLSGRPVEVLVCNAGIYPDRGDGLEDGFAPALWAAGFATNVTGVFLGIQSLLPNLRAARGAKIAIVSSQMGSSARAPGGSYIYRASKAAVLNLGRNLAADLAAEGIAVGIYHPGWVRTDMGGAGAAISPGESAAGLLARIDALSVATTGCFEDWQGRPLPF
jgi:NAD(P)-dependent dehydrogenase (short-subunit alcohol dehydrogenase family)